ncbi:class C sortase [Lactococcus cremoris]|uniref:class C sortase n=1 Tax=Lactococcus lactis subsp. cremoris TaxID=1359 RepID=UPI0003AB9CB7|nr:class C sortase [Lactococcus cremoris]AGV72669.1 sortase family protein [Lactococcus cremoris subsp. cremoris KW2]
MARKKPKTSRKKGFSLRNILSVILAIIAIGLLFYPIVVNYLAGQQNVKSVQKYDNQLSTIGNSKVKQLLAQAQLYNAQLYNEYIYYASQHIAWNKPIPNYNNVLKVDSTGMMGFITIPQIKVNDIPIYHGDSETILGLGVGHVPQSSLPIGGINTHAVLPAHSGRVNDTLFTNLDKLKNGDVFYLHVLDLTLKYKIDDIRIVAPNQVSSLSIEKGRDLVTLVTCYPTGINNKRLLVTGERVPIAKVLPQEKVQRNQFGYNFWVMLGSGLLMLLGLLYLLWLLLGLRHKLYHVADRKIEAPKLSDGQLRGDFGEGFYLTDSKKLANQWLDEEAHKENQNPDDLLINVYRLEKIKNLSRWIFKDKTENWQNYILEKQGYGDEKHALVVGPVFTSDKKVMQYALKTEEAFEHLKYIKCLNKNKSKKGGGRID